MGVELVAYVCGKCHKNGLYRDDDEQNGLWFIACFVCGNRWPGGAEPEKVGSEEESENMNVMPAEKKAKIETLLREGNGIRETSRQTGAAPETVKRVCAELSSAGESLVCKCGRDIGHKGSCGGRREEGKEPGKAPWRRQQAVSSVVPVSPVVTHPPLTRAAIMGLAEEIKRRYREKVEALVSERDQAVTILERFLELVDP